MSSHFPHSAALRHFSSRPKSKYIPRLLYCGTTVFQICIQFQRDGFCSRGSRFGIRLSMQIYQYKMHICTHQIGFSGKLCYFVLASFVYFIVMLDNEVSKKQNFIIMAQSNDTVVVEVVVPSQRSVAPYLS